MRLGLQASRFAVVGLVATNVHLIVGGTAIVFGMPPLLANLVAFLFAFIVSFAGHREWTFATSHASVSRSLPRFTLVAMLGFALNESVLVVLLGVGVDVLLAFGVAVSAAAALTFILGRLWAFRAV